jgi:hypothetical protein
LDDQANSSTVNPRAQAHFWVEIRSPFRLIPRWTRLCRPLDLLCLYHERIEALVREQAGVKFDRMAEPGKLVLVAAR